MACASSSWLSSAAFSPISGFAPAPSPFVSFSPICMAVGGLTELERLLIGIDPDEFYSQDILFHHAVYCVISGAADTDHKNPCGILCLIYFYF